MILGLRWCRHVYRMAACAVFLAAAAVAQAQCDPTVPVLTVDLSASPSATYLSPLVQRQGLCCGNSAPDRCLLFVITLHPDAQGIMFDICAGAVPPGALFYQIGCGPSVAVGQPICLSGAGPHLLTFCKPGNNNNQYCITSIPAPVAGPDIAVNEGCTGTVLTSGFAPGTILWTSVSPGTPGTYDPYLSCPTCPTTTVTGQAGYPPFVDYQVCGNAVSPCSAQSFCDTVRVWFNSTLTASIQPAQPTVCFGAAGTTITVVGGGGTPPYSYLWSTGETSASIFVGPGTYTVQLSDTSQCPPTVASVVVTEFLQPIQALAGNDILVCSTNAIATLNGAVTGASGGIWTGGAGTFAPSTSMLNASYTPSPAEVASGQVTLTLTTTGNGTCPGSSDTVLITFATPFQQIGLTPTDASCSNSADGTIAVTPAMAGWTYAWNTTPPQSLSLASGLTTGTYSVSVTDPSGCDTTLSATVNAPAAIALVDLSATDESCAGLDDGSITAQASGGTAPYIYSWSNGASGATINAGAGMYTVSITDANGCAPATGSATINALGQPNQASAGQDLVGCLNDYPIDLQGSVTNATGGVWSGGAGSFLVQGPNGQYMPTTSEITAGGVTLTLTTTGNTSCPPASDQVFIALSNAFLSASLTPTNVSCYGLGNGSIAFGPDVPGNSYLWNDPQAQTAPVAFGLGPGTYTVVVTDALGCDSMFTAAIAEPQPLSIIDLSIANVTCYGGSNGSVSAQIGGGTLPYSIAWTNGQIGTTATGLPAGAIGITVTDANGCIIQGGTSITQPQAISLTAQVPATVCVNAPAMLSAQAAGGSGSYTINWSGIGTGSVVTHSFATNSIVVVTVSDDAGCTGPILSLPVHVLDLSLATLSASNDATVCPGGSIVLSAQLAGYSGTYSMIWSPTGLQGPGPHSVPVTSTMAHTVTITDVCGNSLTEQVNAGLETPPNLVLPDLVAEGCAPFTVTMPDLQLPGPLTYSWNFGDGGTSNASIPTHTYAAGQFHVSLTVMTPAGCSATSSGQGLVNAYGSPTAAFTATPWSTDIDHPSVSFEEQSAGTITALAWDFGDGVTSNAVNPTHHYTDIGTFAVELWVEDAHGCTDSVIHEVIITPVYDLVLPNVFTPNIGGGNGGAWTDGDLSNDVFYPFVRFVRDFRMRVFNRWGEIVFESNDLSTGWDGYYRGQLSAQDVYVYQIWVRFVDEKEITRMGDVTLLR